MPLCRRAPRKGGDSRRGDQTRAPGMAGKIDKDFLKQNQFWIGLGGFALLWLVGVITVVAAGGESAAKKEYDTALGGVKGLGSKAKTKAHEDPWIVFANAFEGRKKKAWEQGWKLQEGMYDWPEGMPHLNYPDDDFPLDPRSNYKDKLYKEQFAKF